MGSRAFVVAFDKPLTVLLGGQGSGKSELAILWAKRLVSAGRSPVTLVDLDLFKPMFRSRETSTELERSGIRMVLSSLPAGQIPSAPVVAQEMAARKSWMVVDVGGDAHGAKTLRSMSGALAGRDFNLLFVLNTKRPRTSDPDAAQAELDDIQAESGLRITGLVSNTHLLEDTDAAMVDEGLDTARRLADRLAIPLVAVMVPESLRWEPPEDIETLVVRRMLNPPWVRVARV